MEGASSGERKGLLDVAKECSQRASGLTEHPTLSSVQVFATEAAKASGHGLIAHLPSKSKQAHYVVSISTICFYSVCSNKALLIFVIGSGPGSLYVAFRVHRCTCN
jgi:hypothetical protein